MKVSASAFSPEVPQIAADFFRLAGNETDPHHYARLAEDALSTKLGVPKNWVLLTNSCTAALHLAYLMIDSSKPLETQAMTWPSTYSYAPVKYLVDVDWNGLPKWTDRTDVVRVVVSLWGRPVDCPLTGLNIIDAAQAFGLGLDDLRSERAKAVCYSFGAVKEVTTGRGGALVSPYITDQLRAAADSGTLHRNPIVEMGWNYGMTELAAAILPEQLRMHTEHKRQRQRLLERYDQRLGGFYMDVMTRPSGCSGHVMVIRCLSDAIRYKIIGALLKEEIEVSVHYDVPCWMPLTDTPVAADLARRLVTLPLHTHMSEKSVNWVCDVVEKAVS